MRYNWQNLNYLPDLIKEIRKLNPECKLYLFPIPLKNDYWQLRDKRSIDKGNLIFSGYYYCVYEYLCKQIDDLKQINKGA